MFYRVVSSFDIKFTHKEILESSVCVLNAKSPEIDLVGLERDRGQ